MIELKIAICGTELANSLREPCRAAVGNNNYENGLALLDALSVPHIKVGLTGVRDFFDESTEIGIAVKHALENPDFVVDLRVPIEDTTSPREIADIFRSLYRGLNEVTLKWFHRAAIRLFHGIEYINMSGDHPQRS